MVERVDSNVGEIWGQLIRLDSVTCTSVLTPGDRLSVALEAKKIGVRPTAKIYSVDKHVVSRAVRDAEAAEIFLSGQETTLEKADVRKQVEVLKQIDEELKTLNRVTKEPEVDTILKKAPHIKELFGAYFRFRTVKPLFDELEIPYTQSQLWSIRRYFRESVPEDSLNGLTQLSRRYVLAKWLHGIGFELDRKISQAAEFVLSNDYFHLSRLKEDKVASIKIFLRWAMNKEYKSMGGEYAIPEDLEMFPKNYSGTDEEIVEVYRQYGKAGYCPATLKEYANWAVNEKMSGEKRAAKIEPDPYYSKARLHNIDLWGLRFMENTLVWPGNSFRWQTWMMNTWDILVEAKRKMLEVEKL